jgi:outer membrane protein assembly factor BamA
MHRLLRASIGLLVWLTVGRGNAQAPPSAAPPAAPVAPAAPAAPAAPGPQTTEFNIVPLIGGNSDVGVGFGQLSNYAGLAPGVTPYRWSLETSAFISFKARDGGLVVPYQDYFIALHLPNLGEHQVRLDLRLAYTDESTIKFYGIGNMSPVPGPGVPVEDTEYQRIHPTASVEVRYPVFDQLYVNAGSIFTYNELRVRPTSVLGQYATAGPADGRPFVGPFTSHGVEILQLGLQYDTRDNEIDTRSGQYHAVQLRVSPRLGTVLPYRYQRVTATERYYLAVTSRITLSARIVGDALFGDPPFYALARYEETPAIGGVNAIRGVPAGRYYGRIKLFGNGEARADVFGFHLRGKAMKLGVAAFFDAGRTWAELLHRHPDLDGTGTGLKYGVGGGLRLQQGATFVVRADLAYSPDASPVGAYFTAGQIF